MDMPSAGEIRATCPECHEVGRIGRRELERDFRCVRCGTVFFVARERRWRWIPRRRSTRELEEATCGVRRPPRRNLLQTSLVVGALLVLLLTLAVALNRPQPERKVSEEDARELLFEDDGELLR